MTEQNAMEFSERFRVAMEFSTPKLVAKVRNLRPFPVWVGRDDKFWIRNENREGHEYLEIDAATGQRRLAFDHKNLAAGLQTQGVKDAMDTALPLQDLRVAPDEFTFSAGGKRFRSDLAGRCEEIPTPSQTEIVSPDGEWKAFVKDFNIWIAKCDTGEAEQLTHDGVDGFAYGDADVLDLQHVPRRRGNLEKAPQGLCWSPDGRYLLVVKSDSRALPFRPFITEHFASDQVFSLTHMVRHAVAADHRQSIHKIFVIDTQTGKSAPADIPSTEFENVAVQHFCIGSVWWAPERGKAFVETSTLDSRTFGIYEIDLPSGSARKIVEEKEEFYYDYNPHDYELPNFHVTADGNELIWYSQRSGYGHLYLYDVSNGRLKNAVTEGEWIVFNLMRVDEAGRRIFFTAGGLDEGENPYHAKLYSIGFDGTGMKELTPEKANHLFARNPQSTPGAPPISSPAQISPSGKYIVDVFSTNELPAVMNLRSCDGVFIAGVARTDASELFDMGWKPAERFVVKAADGETDLWGVMYKPTHFDSNKKYPVVDNTYPGPQASFGSNSFLLGTHLAINMQALAELGFIVINVDGRGTSHRGRKFRYAFAGTEDVFGAVDQKTTIENLAKDRPYMDIDRVGIKGGSFGGYGSTRAMLLFPDFFKVNVSYVGPHDYEYLHQTSSNERFFMNDDDPEKVAANYKLVNNTHLVDRLKGKLFLVWGEIDENVPLNNAFVMLQALLDADVEFDSLIVPNQPHNIQHPAVLKKEFKYFYEHLKPTV